MGVKQMGVKQGLCVPVEWRIRNDSEKLYLWSNWDNSLGVNIQDNQGKAKSGQELCRSILKSDTLQTGIWNIVRSLNFLRWGAENITLSSRRQSVKIC